ncbi:MAG: S8 family serine peptidase, partial [Actinomycetota bacterium]|nr:S8 family serine peptidase [Actinomycetota bacterium]
MGLFSNEAKKFARTGERRCGSATWRARSGVLVVVGLVALTLLATGTLAAISEALRDRNSTGSGQSSAPNGPTDAPAGALPAAAPAAGGANTTLLVKLAPGLSDQAQNDMVQRNGGTKRASIPQLRLLVVDVPNGQAAQHGQRYQGESKVERVEMDVARQAAAAPNDPAYSDQWALPKIGWDSVFGTVSPSGSAKVAVLDTGVDASVLDLSGRVEPGYSAFGSDPGTDPNGHGTWLASIVAAQADNGTGIAGVGYGGVSVLPVQVLAADGTGNDSDIIAGVTWAADNGASVILMGFSNPGFSQSLQDSVDYAWSKGAVLVAATGNDGTSEPTYPAGDTGVMGVSATDQADVLWTGSNYGAATFIAAPGVGIA